MAPKRAVSPSDGGASDESPRKRMKRYSQVEVDAMDEEEQLRRVMELSAMEAVERVDLAKDEEDELARAIAASLEEQKGNNSGAADDEDEEDELATPSPELKAVEKPLGSPPTYALTMNRGGPSRQQMERERLQRAEQVRNSRVTRVQESPASYDSKSSVENSKFVNSVTPTKAQTQISSNRAETSRNIAPSSSYRAQQVSKGSGCVIVIDDDDDMTVGAKSKTSSNVPNYSNKGKGKSDPNSTRYWRPTILRTYNTFYPNTPDAVQFRDIIGDVGDLTNVIVSTFCSDPGWFFTHFPRRVNHPTEGRKDGATVLIIQHTDKDDPTPRDVILDASGDGVVKGFWMLFPSLINFNAQMIGCHHMKFAIFQHDNYLRVCIATANLVPYDWKIIENSIFIIDFPVYDHIDQTASQTSTSTNPVLPPFISDFIHVLKCLGVSNNWVSFFTSNKYDFSSVSGDDAPRLVWSLNGKGEWTKGDVETERGGMFRLGKAVRDLRKGDEDVELECQGSSTGGYTREWIDLFYGFAAGKEPNMFVNTILRRKTGWSQDQEWPPVQVLFPTDKIVKDSKEGYDGGGTMFCSWRTWAKQGFPQHLFRKAKSKREGILMHVKMILGLTKEQEDGFLYVGSHNFTPSAWGRFVAVPMKEWKGMKESRPFHFQISNNELGVVLPLKHQEGNRFMESVDELVTWKRPLIRYGKGEQPWMQHTRKVRLEKGEGVDR